MKIKAILIGVILLFGASVFTTTISAQNNQAGSSGTLSQGIVWSENFDSYTAGSLLGGQGGWHPWGDSASADANVVDDQCRSNANSVDIKESSDMVHEWTNINYGNCTFRLWAFVPANFEGQNMLILLSLYAGDSSKWDLQLQFDSESKTLQDYDGSNTTPYEINNWGEIRVEIDFINDRQDVYYNDVLWLSKSWTNGTSGGGFLSLGGIDLYANGGSTVYWDDLSIWVPERPNLAPDKPSQPSGQTNGKIGQGYPYTTSTTDPEGDQVFYMWDWGDGNTSGWLGPSNSGVTISTTYKWTSEGSYSIKVKAKDTSGAESAWSDPLPIKMPYTYKPILQFLELLFQRFPNAFPILRHLVGY